MRSPAAVAPTSCDRLRALADARLVCVGAAPPAGADPLPAWVEPEGWCDRATAAGREKYSKLLKESHFLCIPSRADFYGVTLVEGLAHGVPCVAPNAGGAPTIVRSGRSGALLDPNAPPSAYADAIAEGFLDATNYAALAASARDDYEKRLDWPRATAALEAAFRAAKKGARPCADSKE